MSDTSTGIEAQIPRLRRYALLLTHSQVEADELVQDCLVRALSNIHQWEDGTDLRAWLFAITRNHYINKIRRSSREGTRVPVSEDEPLLLCAPAQPHRLELRDLHRALGQLSEEQREVVLLIGLEGMSYEAAANSALLKSLFDQPRSAVTATSRMTKSLDGRTTRKIATAFPA